VKVFFDTNVLLDGYYKRAGHDTSDEAIERCRLCDAGVILTRNTTDFKASPIPVMTPEEFLIQLSH
jgi:hypothetical protein